MNELCPVEREVGSHLRPSSSLGLVTPVINRLLELPVDTGILSKPRQLRYIADTFCQLLVSAFDNSSLDWITELLSVKIKKRKIN